MCHAWRCAAATTATVLALAFLASWLAFRGRSVLELWVSVPLSPSYVRSQAAMAVWTAQGQKGVVSSPVRKGKQQEPPRGK